MLAISLAVHAICALMLIGGRSHLRGAPTINYIDLAMSELQSGKATSNSATQTIGMTPPRENRAPDRQAPAPPSEAKQLRQDLQNAVDSAAEQPEALQRFSFGLGLVNGRFGTIADGRTLRDDMREYYLSLLSALNEKWWVDGSRYEKGGDAIINIVIARNGEVVRANMLQSSGNPAFDRAILKSLEAAAPLPPLPAGFDGAYFTAPIRFTPPLNLLSSSR